MKPDSRLWTCIARDRGATFPFAGDAKAIVDARGSAYILAQYFAVRAGARKSLDDWVPVQRLEAVRTMLRRLGLVIEGDCLFQALPKGEIAGLALSPTTRAAAAKYRPSRDRGSRGLLHVVVSTRRSWAEEALAAGWYPLCVKSRVVTKPVIDHLRFGLALGYPQCCSQFFLERNDWPRFNTLTEAATQTASFGWSTNCLLKQSPFGLIFHMPCRFDCEPSERIASETWAAIACADRDYATAIREVLAQVYLSISERISFVLINARRLGEKVVTFDRAVSLHRLASVLEPSDWVYARSMRSANRIAVQDGTLFIYRDARLLRAIETRCDRGVVECPAIFDFREHRKRSRGDAPCREHLAS